MMSFRYGEKTMRFDTTLVATYAPARKRRAAGAESEWVSYLRQLPRELFFLRLFNKHFSVQALVKREYVVLTLLDRSLQCPVLLRVASASLDNLADIRPVFSGQRIEEVARHRSHQDLSLGLNVMGNMIWRSQELCP